MPTTDREQQETAGCWGHPIRNTKTVNSIRVGFQNINGLPLQNNLKSLHLIEAIQDYNFDYFGVQEINTHERILPPNLQ